MKISISQHVQLVNKTPSFKNSIGISKRVELTALSNIPKF